ncbi:hypothetical protein D9758_013901 [Tetrapyrgos nigripes]|uniref:AB hydrolase-1 domain-containing protein n=1 Tax=Tetrapyrgos nigripes TaxID=182062 RepID=A0A8H5CPF8_9AGAR|nr:hypothetical protein D9758_013901 [Tetrapyrgos nigripes]
MQVFTQLSHGSGVLIYPIKHLFLLHRYRHIIMDVSAYRATQVSRGFTYRYHFTAPKEGHPTIVFIHGFPSTAYDWHHQIKFFKEKGYGLVVPDMLGYGQTSIVFDAASYKHTLLAKDVMDVLDTEKIQKAIVIGHDWGSTIVSAIVQIYGDRVIAAGFLAAGYTVPNPKFNYEAVMAFTKEKLGYEALGYWEFFAGEGADKIIEENWDAFQALVWCEDPKEWVTYLSPRGALKSYLTSGQKVTPASWLTAEVSVTFTYGALWSRILTLPLPCHTQDRKTQMQTLLMGGFTGPLNYYTVVVSGLQAEDDATIPEDKYVTDKPVFFGVTVEDDIMAPMQKATVEKFAKNGTIKEFKTGHWVQMQAPEELNKELLNWIESL